MRYYITKGFLIQELKNNSVQEIANKLHCAKSTIFYNIKKLNIELPSKDLTPGTIYGQLKVINRAGTKKTGTGKNTSALYYCECLACGKFTYIPRVNLICQGKTCGCSHFRKGTKSPLYKGYFEITGKMWSGIKKAALSRNITFDISIEYAWDLYKKQDGLCALTKQPMSFIKNSFNKASLDRIDSTKGYVIDNVQWIFANINIMKNNLSQNDFIKIYKLISDNN